MNTHNQSNEDVPVPQERLGQTEVKDIAHVAAESSTSKLANSKVPALQLKEQSKDFYEPKISNEAHDYTCSVDTYQKTNNCPNQRDSHFLQFGEKEIQEAEVNASSNGSPEKTEEAPRIDSSVIQHMKRQVHIFDAKSGTVLGEIHAQYLSCESDGDDRPPAINTVETQTNGPESGTTKPQGSQLKCRIGNSKTTMKDGNIPTCSTENRTMNILGLRVIDSEITLLSTEIIEFHTQGPKSESTSDIENDYLTRHPLMRLFLCGACCCSKEVKTKGTKKVGLFQRIRNFFRRN